MEKPYIKYYENKDWLQNEYSTLQKSSREIGNDLHVSYKLIEIWLRKFDIPVRQPISYQASGCTYYRICQERSLVPMGMQVQAFPYDYCIPRFSENLKKYPNVDLGFISVSYQDIDHSSCKQEEQDMWDLHSLLYPRNLKKFKFTKI